MQSRKVCALFVLASAAAAIVVVEGCKDDNCADTATCAAPRAPDSGVDAGYPPVPPPPGCDHAADPQGQTACIADGYSLFVDNTNGNDANAGTRVAPFKTIAAATNIDHLAGRQRIYVCDGSAPYDEHIVLPTNVSLVGGFACGSWQYVGTPTSLNVTTPGLVVRITPSSSGAVVQMSDFTITAADGVLNAESSVAVFVANATATFHRLNITAGIGVQPLNWANQPSNKTNVGVGHNGVMSTPGGSITCNCPIGGTTTGGAGGAPGVAGSDGSAVPDPLNGAIAPTAGSGGASCGFGLTGHGGTAGGGGAAAPAIGSLDPELGWVGGVGGNGAFGGPGVGGGGGGGGSASGVGGGGGGCGGCGGNGGRGGKAGGSSIALATLQSNVALFACALVAKNAGAGGTGESGESGTLGFAGGGAKSSACSGGQGGPGGGGGGGASGSGGVSAAIVYSGGTVTHDPATTLASGLQGGLGNFGFGGLAITGGEAMNGPGGDQGATSPYLKTATTMYPLTP